MKRALSTAILLILMSVFTVAQAHAEAPIKYGVVTEIDKGEGVFVLERITSWRHAASEWGGAIAEFKRRHLDLEVLSHSIVTNAQSMKNGVVINTAPKNRCRQ